jgi:hypothetical protein
MGDVVTIDGITLAVTRKIFRGHLSDVQQQPQTPKGKRR